MSTLLLADGDPSVRTTLARSLAGYGIAVIATANVQEATGVPKPGDADILVTELVLPGTDGLALLAYVKQHAANLPTVVLSAADPAAQGERLTELGSPRVLRNPLSVKELVRERHWQRAQGPVADARVGAQNLLAAGELVNNTRVVRAKPKTMADPGLGEELEAILITLSTQYHLLRALPS